MKSFVFEYWELIAAVFYFLVAYTINHTIYKNIDVRPYKDHIEDGWGQSLDESHNECLEHKRSVVSRTMWLFIILTFTFRFVSSFKWYQN